MLNEFGYPVVLHRTDHIDPSVKNDTAFGKRRHAETLLRQKRMTKVELAKHLDCCPRQAVRICQELSIYIPLIQDEKWRWYVMGSEAEKCF